MKNKTFTTPWTGRGTRFASLAASGLLALGACGRPVTPPPPTPAPEPIPVPAPVPPAPPPPSPIEAPRPRGSQPSVAVGLSVNVPRTQVGATQGFEAVDARSGRILGRGAAGTSYGASGAGGGVRLADVSGGPTWQAGGTLLVRPLAGGTVTVNGKPYRGILRLQPGRGNQVSVVNELSIEDYLLGVVPQEIGRLDPGMLEAAKAQAVAARTYAVARRDRRQGLGFNFYADVQDQVYGGIAAENDEVTRAVRATEGEILVYAGKPIDAYYHSTCAGQTAAIEEVWNERAVPYLRSVVDVDPRTGESWDRTSSRFRWTVRWTGPELTRILNKTLADSLPRGANSIGTLRDLRVIDRTPSGRIRALRIETSSGNYTVGKDRIRWILLTPAGAVLNSSKFDVEVTRSAGGAVSEVVAQGGGWGHGIGMCQVGAKNRAVAGQDYEQILKTYYTGAELRDEY